MAYRATQRRFRLITVFSGARNDCSPPSVPGGADPRATTARGPMRRVEENDTQLWPHHLEHAEFANLGRQPTT